MPVAQFLLSFTCCLCNHWAMRAIFHVSSCEGTKKYEILDFQDVAHNRLRGRERVKVET